MARILWILFLSALAILGVMAGELIVSGTKIISVGGGGGGAIAARTVDASKVDPYAGSLIDLWYRATTNTTSWTNIIAGGKDLANYPSVATGPTLVQNAETYPAFSFDGSDDAFTGGSNSVYGSVTAGVWMAWVKYDAPAVSERFTLFGASKTNLSPPGVAWFLCEVYNPAGTPQWVIRAGKASTTYWSFSAPAGTSISTNTWQLVAMANDGYRTRLFVDNVFLGTATSGAGPIPNTAWFALMFTDHFLTPDHFCDSVHIGMYKNSAGTTFYHPKCEISQVRNYGNVYFTNFTWYADNTHPENDLEITFGR